MIENPISSNSLYNQCSTLNYTQAAMMGLTGSSLQDSQQLGYGNHGNIPNIILTGSGGSSASRLKESSSAEVDRNRLLLGSRRCSLTVSRRHV